ncbi:MAG: ATP-binding protein [Alphaproteobacteria bacterium]
MSATATSRKKAGANPTKAFFVTMITRDITLEDCILDLIDNSVDGAWRCEGSRPMGLSGDTDLSKYSIQIDASPTRFRISDNCGGMTLDDAIEHAFSFGRRAIDQYDRYSIGVYGIGMKRAVFKLGTDIRIRSTYEDNGKRESFAVPIVVDKWLADDEPPWDFDIDEDEPLAENGVEVSINKLTPEAERLFDNPSFIQNLRRTISRDYSLHLNRGLKIYVNGSAVPGWEIDFRQGAEFEPMRVEYKDRVGEDEVSVIVIGGMAAPPPENAEPDEDDVGEKKFGWYVACNGRIVLAADTTSISGWGTDDWPHWHPQYSGFVGIVLFTAANAAALPLTTTKRSVDLSSEIYRRARPYMREVSRQWIAYTHQRKQALDEAKEKEAAARPLSIYQVQERSAVVLPQLVARPTERVANIHYSVSITKVRKLARELGSINMTYRDVGLINPSVK